jgi:hypothetical protein
LSAEDGTANTVSGMERQSDECRSKAENQHEGIVTVAQSQVEMGRPRGKTERAQMGTGCINVERKNRQKKWATEDPMGRHVQEDSGHEQPKPERMEYTHTASVKPMSQSPQT